ncbi:MAG: SUMF1/EgtB/PvdO family nonheme iron enzyme [Alphaproteobacteria bacterium]|nr:SUMF1/EgtB/PvdO family nonheme iron enzyme [Alphaproteobacteria bacterium]
MSLSPPIRRPRPVYYPGPVWPAAKDAAPHWRCWRDGSLKALAVGEFEVTFAEWVACVAAGGRGQMRDDEGRGRGDRPLFDVSWRDAKEYVAWLSRKTGHARENPLLIYFFPSLQTYI